MFKIEELSILKKQVIALGECFSDLPFYEEKQDMARIEAVLDELSSKLADNYPYYHPFYLGQMLKPPHPIARLAYSLCLYINPNNHALDGGRATSVLEKACVAEIAGMFGWSVHLGHLTSGGTFANLEALWIAKKLHPKKRVVASELAHYTHERISDVLGLGFKKISCNTSGVMDIEALVQQLQTGDVGTVIVTLGTTACGTVDALDEIIELKSQYDFRIHVDSAYGGYFSLCRNLGEKTSRAFENLHFVDSIVVDPHKHGMQPYGCGCIMFKDPSVGAFYKHDSPYTYFSSDELHLGEISLECSRAGASAAALWATQQLIPLKVGADFSVALESGREAALAFFAWVNGNEHTLPVMEPELDIVLWIIKSDNASSSSALSQSAFEKAAKRNIHLALTRIPKKLLADKIPSDSTYWDVDEIVSLRACLMKPSHKEWLPRIQALVGDAIEEALDAKSSCKPDEAT
ncbi:aminotransferase class I/II-fold pyridoxal phosphate-dependent enzyme [Serratia fonticola]|uniref:Aminotransferase class I/II-fold pyridoxal phosphate-dependent enzyme n=1 Tax=Serratia fonticola TaxID=47917 RepID=A0AAJ2D8F2_SERFO|nr:aminotransferase class I/II-fold pyridoxal phosphate-dependent enzyme [Serratia fonticola]MDQ9126173.1 aminotransferase class I/II-fold pyridoxal phosphate-dependent enzyme [Serratia fonticola]